jgi:hypothetical protein
MKQGWFIAAAVALLLSGCASVQDTVGTVQVAADPNSPLRKDATAAGQRVGDAAAAPLHDVNLIQTKIPAVLLDAADAPYARPSPLTCRTVRAELEPLEAALPPDLDLPKPPPQSRVKRGETMAGDAAIDSLKVAAEGVIPMRGWVRMLSGAKRHDKLVRAAVLAGQVRRAYLKGLGMTLSCGPPAAPPPFALEAKPAPRPTLTAQDAPRR